jgi:hypothetical protein
MEFSATVDLDGKTATGIAVPDTVIEQLGAGKRPLVRVSINGHHFSTTIGSMKGTFKIPVSAQNRALAGIDAGDEVSVTLVLDATPAEIEVPDDLQSALLADPTSAAFFSTLTTSQKKGFITPIEQAKAPDTRARRVEKAMIALKAGLKRP